MVSKSFPSMDVVVDVATEKRINGSSPCKKNRSKLPRKIHKAEREKLKRDHLNELFFELSHALDPARQNNGKAAILSDSARLLRDLVTQVGSLQKENTALLTESHYVTAEKNELQDDNAALKCDIDRLQNEIQERMKRDHPPPSDNPSVSPVFVVPLSGDLRQDMNEAQPKRSSHISRPHARYATPSDSWPLEFLSRNLEGSKKVV